MDVFSPTELNNVPVDRALLRPAVLVAVALAEPAIIGCVGLAQLLNKHPVLAELLEHLHVVLTLQMFLHSLGQLNDIRNQIVILHFLEQFMQS